MKKLRFKPMRTSTKSPVFKLVRNATKRHSKEAIDVQKATYSSNLKDRKCLA